MLSRCSPTAAWVRFYRNNTRKGLHFIHVFKTTPYLVIKLATRKHNLRLLATSQLGHVWVASHKNRARISTLEITEIWRACYDYQLSKEQWKFGDLGLKFNLNVFSCCHGQLSPFPGETCQPLGSLAAKCRKLQAMILLPLEIRNAACGDKSKTLSPKLCQALLSSTDNHSQYEVQWDW